MAKVCDFCSKSSQKGKKIALIWGVKYRSIRHREPNLRDTTVFIDGVPVKARVCTKCLKNIKGDKYLNVKSYTQKYNEKSENTVSESNKTSEKTSTLKK